MCALFGSGIAPWPDRGILWSYYAADLPVAAVNTKLAGFRNFIARVWVSVNRRFADKYEGDVYMTQWGDMVLPCEEFRHGAPPVPHVPLNWRMISAHTASSVALGTMGLINSGLIAIV
jgi:hypothetical protein